MIVILRVVTCTHNLETGAAVGDKRTWNCVKKPVTYSTLLLMTIFLSALGSSHHPPTPSSNVVAKKSTHFHPLCSRLTLSGVGGKGSLVLPISLEMSQHFWPPIVPTRGWQPLLSGSTSHTATLTHNNLLLNGFYSQARSSVPLKISLTRPLVIQLKYCPVLPSLNKVDYYYYYNELIIWKVNPLVIAWTSIKFKSAFLHVEWAVNFSW